jgi:hypothetical protein
LFLVGIYGERPKSSKEIMLATERAIGQLALARWRIQKAARIDQMACDGEPLAPVSAAMASPETAERIAMLEAATSGGLPALDAAQLTVHRAGHDVGLIAGLTGDERGPFPPFGRQRAPTQ